MTPSIEGTRKRSGKTLGRNRGKEACRCSRRRRARRAHERPPEVRAQRDLPARACSVTLSYVKASITIRLDRELERELHQACAETGRTRSDLARYALRRQISLARFERARRKIMPFAEARGYLTDEDIFRAVS